MKSIKTFLASILTLFALFAFTAETNAQGIVGVKSYDMGTLTNTVWTGYQSFTFAGVLKEFGCSKIDSITVSMTVDGEADVDTLNVYPANWTIKGTAVLGSVITYTVTLNVAAAGTGTEALYVSNHGIQAASFRNKEGITWRTRGAVSGNDPTDPNTCKVTFTFYGS
jgi:hypothetical protein